MITQEYIVDRLRREIKSLEHELEQTKHTRAVGELIMFLLGVFIGFLVGITV